MDINSTYHSSHNRNFLKPTSKALLFIKNYAAAAIWIKAKGIPEFVVMLN